MAFLPGTRRGLDACASARGTFAVLALDHRQGRTRLQALARIVDELGCRRMRGRTGSSLHPPPAMAGTGNTDQP
jgi:hypothetical protein